MTKKENAKSTIRISAIILTLCCLGVPTSAKAQQTGQATTPLSSVVEYLQRTGIEKDLNPKLVAMLGWPTRPYTAKWQVLEDNAGTHVAHLVTERGRIELIFMLRSTTSDEVVVFCTTPSGIMERVFHGNRQRGRHEKPRAESLEIFLKETHFWLRQAASATKK